MPVTHYENFPVASLVLPRRLRAPIEALYHFARHADDLADEGEAAPAERLAALARVRSDLAGALGGAKASDPVVDRVASAVREGRLPGEGLFDLLDAFEQDVRVSRYARYADLVDYCRRSADPIGRALLHLFGAGGEDALRESDSVCTGLQLVNHWQDVALDWRRGRVYLPQEDMARFGVTEAHIAQCRADAAWRALMDFEVRRALGLLEAGAGLARRLPGRVGLEVALIVAAGRRVGQKLLAVEGDVFRRRPRLVAGDWPAVLLAAVRSAWGTAPAPAAA
jgi:squalene synthase HpnC